MAADVMNVNLMPCVPLLGAWAWHPQDSQRDRTISEDDLLDSFNGTPTLAVIDRSDDEGTLLCWRVDGYFSNLGLWLYVDLMAEDIKLLDSQDVMQPEQILLNRDLDRLVAWSRTKYNRIVNRGSVVVEGGTAKMGEILSLLPIDPILLTSPLDGQTSNSVESVVENTLATL